MNRTQISMLTIAAVFSLPAFAASSATLTVSGVVALVNDISVTPNGTNNTSLNIVGGETAKNVASVVETSNNAQGYVIQMSSANGGKLKSSSNNQQTSYTISYGGGSYAAPNTNPTTVKTVNSLTGLTSNTSQVAINVTALPTASAGTYSDTITFAISAL